MSVHPGCIVTDIGRHVVELPGWVRAVLKLAVSPFFKDVHSGASTQVGAPDQMCTRVEATQVVCT